MPDLAELSKKDSIERGKRFLVAGLLVGTVHIGDRFQVESAYLVMTQPGLPCYKLGLKFCHHDILKRYLQSGLADFYFSVFVE